MQLYIIAGPNGSGKSTVIKKLMPTLLQCEEYINVDAIAYGLSPFHPESVAVQAAKLALKRTQYLIQNKISFAFETTLSSRTLKFLNDCKSFGYKINIIFLYLNTVNLAIQRVEDRVKSGGHQIPVHVIKRRYKRSLFNFINHYIALADNWFVYNNSDVGLTLISKQEKDAAITIVNKPLWEHLIEEAKYEYTSENQSF